MHAAELAQRTTMSAANSKTRTADAARVPKSDNYSHLLLFDDTHTLLPTPSLV